MRFEKGEEAILDLQRAKENGKFGAISFRRVDKQEICVKIDKVYRREDAYPYNVLPLDIEASAPYYTQHVEGEWLRRKDELCDECKQKKIFHDTEDRYFCPWCEE